MFMGLAFHVTRTKFPWSEHVYLADQVVHARLGMAALLLYAAVGFLQLAGDFICAALTSSTGVVSTMSVKSMVVLNAAGGCSQTCQATVVPARFSVAHG